MPIEPYSTFLYRFSLLGIFLFGCKIEAGCREFALLKLFPEYPSYILRNVQRFLNELNKILNH